jgi:hypothetical protein
MHISQFNIYFIWKKQVIWKVLTLLRKAYRPKSNTTWTRQNGVKTIKLLQIPPVLTASILYLYIQIINIHGAPADAGQQGRLDLGAGAGHCRRGGLAHMGLLARP